MFEILTEVAKIGPVVAILIVAIWYFIKKEKKYQQEIKDLNQSIRDNEKESLGMINKLADALDRIADAKGDIHTEIVRLKEFISLKLEKINSKNEN